MTASVLVRLAAALIVVAGCSLGAPAPAPLGTADVTGIAAADCTVTLRIDIS